MIIFADELLADREVSGPAYATAPPKIFPRFFSAALVLVSCVLSQGFLPLGRFLGKVEVLDPGVSDPWANTLQAFVLLTMLGGTALNFRLIKPLLGYGKWMLPIFIYCFASTVWSDSPGTTLRRAAIMFTYLVNGYFIFAMVGARGAIRLMNIGSFIMLSVSLALFIFIPRLGADVEPYAGALRGVFSQKTSRPGRFRSA